MCNMGTRKLQGRLEKLLRKKEGGGGGERERITCAKTNYIYMCRSNALLVVNKCLYKAQSNKTTKAHGHLLRI